jgi:hypothetical protein
VQLIQSLLGLAEQGQHQERQMERLVVIPYCQPLSLMAVAAAGQITQALVSLGRMAALVAEVLVVAVGLGMVELAIHLSQHLAKEIPEEMEPLQRLILALAVAAVLVLQEEMALAQRAATVAQEQPPAYLVHP